jgi:heme/copper-type cytochrome/quinol oxidase subunit 4
MTKPTQLPVPKSTDDDARQRAIRSYLGGLIAAVIMAVAPLGDAALGNIQWSRAWWIALGLGLVSPALHAVVAYVLRHLAPPA